MLDDRDDTPLQARVATLPTLPQAPAGPHRESDSPSTVPMPITGWRDATRRWVQRYGPPELAGLAAAWLGYLLVLRVTGSATAAAFGASLGENVGFYGTFILRAVVARDGTGRGGLRTPVSRRLWRNALVESQGAVLEFGPAEVVDSFVARPLAIALASDALGAAAGVPAGKVAADVVFYAITIAGFELRRRSRAG